MFSEELEKIDWDETTAAIYAKTDADVRRALSKSHLDVQDFMALISPAAEPYLEQMAQLSYKYTRERFGIRCRCSFLYILPTLVPIHVSIAVSMSAIR